MEAGLSRVVEASVRLGSSLSRCGVDGAKGGRWGPELGFEGGWKDEFAARLARKMRGKKKKNCQRRLDSRLREPKIRMEK